MVVLCISIGSVCATDSSYSDKFDSIGNLNSLSVDDVNRISEGSNLKISSEVNSVSISSVDSSSKDSNMSKIINVTNDKVSSLNISYNASTTLGEGSSSLNNDVNVSSISAASSKKVSINNILTSSSNFKTYVLKYNSLPATVKVGDYTVSASQFSYLMTVALDYIKNGKSLSTTIVIKNIGSKTSSYSLNYNVNKNTYLSMAKKVYNSCISNGYVLSYVAVGSYKCDFKTYTYAFAKCLVYYKGHKQLPATCWLESGVYSKKVTIAQVISKSVDFKAYVLKNAALPNQVNIGNYQISSSQFTNLMSVAINYLNAGKKTSTLIYLKSVNNNSAISSISKTVSKSDYLKLSSKISTYTTIPDYMAIADTKVDYRSTAYAFSKCLAFYKSYGVLPNTCLFQSNVFKNSTGGINLSDVLTSANNVKNYVDAHKCLPKTVNVKGTNCNMTDFLYIMSCALKDISNSKTSGIYVLKSYKDPSGGISDWVVTSASKVDYLSMYDRINNYMVNNGQAPNYATLSGSYKVSYSLYTYALSKILVYYKNNNVLPTSCTFDDKVFESYYSCINSSEVTTVYLTSDNIRGSNVDSNMLYSIKSSLEKLGYKVVVIGVGPNKHNEALDKGCTGPNSVLLCCFGGVDVGCIEEWSGVNAPEYGITPWAYKKLNGAKVLSVFYSEPYGYCANINNRVDPAWDAYYGYSLDNPAQFMETYGISYIQTGTVDRVCSIVTSMFKK